jgi:putative membrane protein
VLYLLLIAGGVWHLLGWFQNLMRILAAPLLAGLALLLAISHSRRYADRRRQGILFYAGVGISACGLEYLGVISGRIFGSYSYGPILQPQLLGVPLAIGFAWLAMVLSSAGIADLLTARAGGGPPWVRIPFIALLMVLFDWIMEPAAIKLGYWSWQNGEIPWQNYLAWFLFAMLYAAWAWQLGLLQKGAPVLSRHAWLAQILYFLLVRV